MCHNVRTAAKPAIDLARAAHLTAGPANGPLPSSTPKRANTNRKPLEETFGHPSATHPQPFAPHAPVPPERVAQFGRQQGPRAACGERPILRAAEIPMFRQSPTTVLPRYAAGRSLQPISKFLRRCKFRRRPGKPEMRWTLLSVKRRKDPHQGAATQRYLSEIRPAPRHGMLPIREQGSKRRDKGKRLIQDQMVMGLRNFDQGGIAIE